MLQTWHQIKSNEEVLLSANEYDALGQLKNKSLHSKSSTGITNPVQKIDYTYNIRGWLTGINNPNSLGTDLFAMNFFYNDISQVSAIIDKPQYNGNIAAATWAQTLGVWNCAYGYSYDGLNRLTKAQYGELHQYYVPMSNYSEPLITYDKNGNILSYQRNGAGGTLIDNLTYSYLNESNQLSYVNDAASIVDGYKGGTSVSQEYFYDANGNMRQDLNKGITNDIIYNYLNLPQSIIKGSQTIDYSYDATGRKLKHSVNSTIIDYCNNFVYEDGSLTYVLHPEGRINVSGNTYSYEYWLKDHPP